MKAYDVIIIGGGIVGCLTARFLSKIDVTVTAPVQMDQVVIANVLETGIDI